MEEVNAGKPPEDPDPRVPHLVAMVDLKVHTNGLSICCTAGLAGGLNLVVDGLMFPLIYFAQYH